MTRLNEAILPTTSIRNAMAVINASPQKICLIVDDEGQLQRTLSDGDIRRALLDGIALEQDVSCFASQPAIAFPEGTPDDIVLEAMIKNDIQTVVIHDMYNIPVRLMNRSSLEPTLQLSPPHMGTEEVGFILQAIDDNWVAPAGPHLTAFETELAAVADRDCALALSSGTAALHLALKVLNIGTGTRVYVSDLTFVASLNPILYQGAEPVLIDSDPVSWNMSVLALEEQLELDRRTQRLPAAIVVVHLYGQSADMHGISALAEKYGIPIIEDAAESLGATYRNRPSGAHGLMSAFSFNGNKIITTSGGGALVSDREDLIEHARKLSTQGRDTAEHYQHSEIGYNYRMSNILAGIGRGQLAHLQNRVEARRNVFNRYVEGLSDIPGIAFQDNVTGGNGSRWLTVISFEPDVIPLHCFQFMRALRQKGIDSRPAWKPMHMQPLCYQMDFRPHSDTQVVSANLFLRSLCLPSGSAMTEREQDRVISTIRELAG